jgi:hypothetical protein
LKEVEIAEKLRPKTQAFKTSYLLPNTQLSVDQKAELGAAIQAKLLS